MQRSVTRCPELVGFAVIPLAFGIQQFAEGFVWIGLEQQNDRMVSTGAAVFLFFALAFWPLWFPIAAAIAEPAPARRRLMAGWMLVAIGWTWFAWIPLLRNTNEYLSACICGSSIQYAYSDHLVIMPGLMRWTGTFVYLACTIGPLLTMSLWRKAVVPAVLGMTSVFLTAWLYHDTYTSVWCFFASTISIYCIFLFATEAGHNMIPSASLIEGQLLEDSGNAQQKL